MFRNISLIALIFLCIFTTESKSQTTDLPKAPLSPRDLYIGCSLLVRDKEISRDSNGRWENYSPEFCQLAVLAAIANREGSVSGKDNRSRFCLPHNAESDADPTKLMAFAYLDWFEKRGGNIPSEPEIPKAAAASFDAAMITKWPCV